MAKAKAAPHAAPIPAPESATPEPAYIVLIPLKRGVTRYAAGDYAPPMSPDELKRLLFAQAIIPETPKCR